MPRHRRPNRLARPSTESPTYSAHVDRPLTLSQLRHTCRIRTAHVCQALATLTAEGRVLKTALGYQLASPTHFPPAFPAPP